MSHSDELSRRLPSFSGTVPAQILHQGYIDQPTVSLSESFDVCAYWATDLSQYMPQPTQSGESAVRTLTAPVIQGKPKLSSCTSSSPEFQLGENS